MHTAIGSPQRERGNDVDMLNTKPGPHYYTEVA